MFFCMLHRFSDRKNSLPFKLAPYLTARLNCIAHLLEQIPYREVEKPPVVLPDRVRHADYARHEIPPEMYVPELY